MKKELILVVFPTISQCEWHVKDKMMPVMPDMKKIDFTLYETEYYKIKLHPQTLLETMRGYRPLAVLLSDDCNIATYKRVLELVNGNHDNIKVVI